MAMSLCICARPLLGVAGHVAALAASPEELGEASGIPLCGLQQEWRAQAPKWMQRCHDLVSGSASVRCGPLVGDALRGVRRMRNKACAAKVVPVRSVGWCFGFAQVDRA